MSESESSTNTGLLDAISSRFTITEVAAPYGLLTLVFSANDVLALVGFLKDEHRFTYLTDLCGIHYPSGHRSGDAATRQMPDLVQNDSQSVAGQSVSASVDSAGHGTGSGYSAGSRVGNAYDQGENVAGASAENLRESEPIPETQGELGVIYHLHALESNTRIRLKTFFNASAPEIDSLTPLFKGANWMERETYDFYGIIFQGHPDLRRILNVDEMIAFPMRKEFPLEDQHRKDKQDQFFGR